MNVMVVRDKFYVSATTLKRNLQRGQRILEVTWSLRHRSVIFRMVYGRLGPVNRARQHLGADTCTELGGLGGQTTASSRVMEREQRAEKEVE